MIKLLENKTAMVFEHDGHLMLVTNNSVPDDGIYGAYVDDNEAIQIIRQFSLYGDRVENTESTSPVINLDVLLKRLQS